MRYSLRNLTSDEVTQALHAALRDANRDPFGSVSVKGDDIDIRIRAETSDLAAHLVSELEARLNAR